MEQAKEKPMSEADFEKIEQTLRGMDRRAAAEASAHFVISGMLNHGKELHNDQKMDLVNAVLDCHRVTVLAEFLRVLTTTKDGAYDLMTPGDDEKKEKMLRSAVALSIMKSEDQVEQKAKRLFTLCEMLFADEKEPAIQ
jgi:hypothetical protein